MWKESGTRTMFKLVPWVFSTPVCFLIFFFFLIFFYTQSTSTTLQSPSNPTFTTTTLHQTTITLIERGEKSKIKNNTKYVMLDK